MLTVHLVTIWLRSALLHIDFTTLWSPISQTDRRPFPLQSVGICGTNGTYKSDSGEGRVNWRLIVYPCRTRFCESLTVLWIYFLISNAAIESTVSKTWPGDDARMLWFSGQVWPTGVRVGLRVVRDEALLPTFNLIQKNSFVVLWLWFPDRYVVHARDSSLYRRSAVTLTKLCMCTYIQVRPYVSRWKQLR